MQEITYTRPWFYPKQLEAIFEPKDFQGNPARYSIVEASTKSGKTVSCIAWLFEKALKGKSGQNFWWVAPISSQADIAFTRMMAATPHSLYKENLTNKKITLFNGTTIWFKGGDKPDSLYGEDVYAAVIDEASRLKEQAWYSVRSTLTATRGDVRIIGNVKGRKSWMYNLARRAEAGERGMSYHKIVAGDAADAGVLSNDEVADAKRVLPEAIFKELYLAEPSDDGGNPFGLKAISECVHPIVNDAPVVWGIDLAKSVDWTVAIGLNRRHQVCRFERWQSPWPETKARIRRLVGSTKAYVDSTGVGDPIVDDLQRGDATGRKPNFEGFKFSSSSKQMLMEGLAAAIQSKEVSYPDGVIRIELENFEYEYSRTGVKYSAPEGLHDDCVCALALAVYNKNPRNSLFAF